MKTNECDNVVKELTVAMRDLCEYYSPTSDYIPPSASINKVIAKHFAELKATHEKLVELVVAYGDWNEAILNKEFGKANAIHGTICALSTDPIVVAAIDKRKNLDAFDKERGA